MNIKWRQNVFVLYKRNKMLINVYYKFRNLVTTQIRAAKKMYLEFFLKLENPSYFWIDDSSRNRFAFDSISARNPTKFFEHFFFSKEKKKLKSSETYTQFFLQLWREKKCTLFFTIFEKNSNIFSIFFFLIHLFFRLKIVWNVCSKNLMVGSFWGGSADR